MLRVRFHGRGGQGVKTASRILGTAAFRSGLEVQDSPVYGAERRGAAIAAFTRVDTQPIRERGIIAQPDLILVADETLLADPTAGVLAGCATASAVFVNSPRASADLAAQHSIACLVVACDLAAFTFEALGRGAALTVALGAAACALAGLSLSQAREAVREELLELHLGSEATASSLAVVDHVFASVSSVALRERPAPTAQTTMHAVTPLHGAAGMPIIQAPGNAPLRHTGSWRVFRPIIDLAACTRCGICFAVCPDGAIALNASSYPVIDYDNCKGCMMCFQECPIHCISEQREGVSC